jgi:hypothetical protein
MGYVRKFVAGLVKIDSSVYVGSPGSFFLDENTGVMSRSDGKTPGGVVFYDPNEVAILKEAMANGSIGSGDILSSIIDGGTASSIYSLFIDGGTATTTYTASQLINGGTA